MHTPDSILNHAQETMTKAVEHLKKELRSIRTGRAQPSLVEMVRVEYYGSQSELKNIAAISVPEPSQLLIKPFDASSLSDIKKAIETSGIGLNPMVDGKQIRLNIPPLTGERRKQLAAQCKKYAEEAKVAVRNVRRDANKHAEAIKASIPEDELETLKTEVQDLLKKHETEIDDLAAKKTKEVETV
jgi:ribosome recycling factor